MHSPLGRVPLKVQASRRRRDDARGLGAALKRWACLRVAKKAVQGQDDQATQVVPCSKAQASHPTSSLTKNN